MKSGATTCQKMLNAIFRENSLFLTEGKNLLVEEFGREYNVYFSILECIAWGINLRGEIENVIGVKDIGGYLAKLDNDYGLISSLRPLLSPSGSKTLRYYIHDNFLTFWFRFVYKYINYIESGSLTLLKNIVTRDYPTFSGMILERYFRQQAYESGCYTHIGNYWDRRGENEIDIILVNELEQTIVFGEIKRQSDNISLTKLSTKAEHFLSLHPHLKEYKSTLKAFSLADI